jgi:hypothetical protein
MSSARHRAGLPSQTPRRTKGRGNLLISNNRIFCKLIFENGKICLRPQSFVREHRPICQQTVLFPILSRAENPRVIFTRMIRTV